MILEKKRPKRSGLEEQGTERGEQRKKDERRGEGAINPVNESAQKNGMLTKVLMWARHKDGRLPARKNARPGETLRRERDLWPQQNSRASREKWRKNKNHQNKKKKQKKHKKNKTTNPTNQKSFPIGEKGRT